jgi:hypothetical protein
MIRRFYLSIALLIATGCAGGGGGTSLMPQAPIPAPHVTATPASGGISASATLRIVIPARPTSSSTTRTPKYISFATQSIKIVFTPSGGGTATSVTQNLTPTSAGCQGSLSASTTCTVQLPGLSAGTYSADFTMYDGLLDSNNVPTGNVLSSTLGVPETINAGQANLISVTLNGVPTAVAFLPSANSSLSGSAHAGFTLSSCFGSEPAGTEGITVVGLDADGNIIVGAGAPTPGLSSSNPGLATVSSPSATSPNAFVLSGSATPATAGTSFTLHAGVTPLVGSPNMTPISASIPITFVATGCPTPAPTPAPQFATTTSVTSSGTPSTAGQSVTFSASIAVTAPGTGTPTGTVAFMDGASAIAGCSAQPVSSGGATCSTSSLTVGSHSVTATYSGDATFLSSTSNALTQDVHGQTTTAVLANPNVSVTGQSVTITANVLVSAPGTGSPTGQVTFKNGVAVISGCSTQAVSSGSATCTTSSLSVGTHSLTAVYNGDTNFIASTSGPVTESVGQAATFATLTADFNPAVAGQTVTFTASILVTPPGAAVVAATGAVTFRDGGVTIPGCSTVGLSSSAASCTTSSLATGSHSITASYNGDANFLAVTSASFTELVTQAVPSVALVATQPGGPGTPVQFVATVTGAGSVTPTGTVNIATQGSPTTVLASCTLAGSGNTASCSTSASNGPQTVVFAATYTGDTNYTGATGNANALTVQSVRARAR